MGENPATVTAGTSPQKWSRPITSDSTGGGWDSLFWEPIISSVYHRRGKLRLIFSSLGILLVTQSFFLYDLMGKRGCQKQDKAQTLLTAGVSTNEGVRETQPHRLRQNFQMFSHGSHTKQNRRTLPCEDGKRPRSHEDAGQTQKSRGLRGGKRESTPASVCPTIPTYN